MLLLLNLAQVSGTEILQEAKAKMKLDTRVSQPWRRGRENSLLWGCPVRYRLSGSICGLYPLEATSCGWDKHRFLQTCPLGKGTQSFPVEDNVLIQPPRPPLSLEQHCSLEGTDDFQKGTQQVGRRTGPLMNLGLPPISTKTGASPRGGPGTPGWLRTLTREMCMWLSSSQ
jgi:hypothetical protein